MVVEEISHSLSSLGQGQGEALGGSGLSRSLSAFCVDQHTHSGCGQCVLYGNQFLFRQNDILIASGGGDGGAVLPPVICPARSPPVMQMKLMEQKPALVLQSSFSNATAADAETLIETEIQQSNSSCYANKPQ